MATRTPYYGLTKPAGLEDAQISVINANMDILDTELHLTTVRDAKNLAPIYDATSSYVEGDFVTYLITGQSSQDANGYFVFKCIDDTTTPAGNFDTNKWEAVCITDEMGSGGGGGEGGHIFLDNEGTAMPQRAKAKFEGAYSTDNSTDGITNVAVMRTMSWIEYAQLTEEEKQGIIYVDDETTGTDDKFQPVIYSTEEREIGVWTDGKPLYEKTWIALSPSQVNTSEMIVDLSGYNIDKVIAQDAFIVAVDDTNITEHGGGSFVIWNRTPLAPTTPNNCIMCNVSNVSYLSGTIYVTLQYTKTTDTAGSGQWTPQGVPAVHYSTDEQVVGTWIDGSTLYQKTFEYNCQDTSNTQVAYTGNTGDKIVQLVDYYFINSQNVQIRLMWAGQAFWDFISGLSTLTVKRNTNDANWQANVKFVATVQYIKTS